MRVISVLNLKGGVAKTFTAANVAYELYRRGYRVLLIDNDKQGNLSKAYSRYDAENIAPVTKLLAGDWCNVDELIQHTDYEGIDIVTANTQNEGIINAVKNSANIRFLAKVANMLKPEDIKKERKRFTEDNLSADNDSGMIIYDNKFSDLKQVESKPYTPNALQMQHIQENVCTHFGTNMDILQNKFDENTWNAYYEGKIEPFAIQLSLVMTNMSFTERERACGNAIFFSANRLQYASNATKLSVSTQLFDRALLNRNGVMDIWNMAHVEDGEKYYIRKEYTEVSELQKGDEPQVVIQQVPQAGEQNPQPETGETQDGQTEKEGVNNAS